MCVEWVLEDRFSRCSRMNSLMGLINAIEIIVPGNLIFYNDIYVASERIDLQFRLGSDAQQPHQNLEALSIRCPIALKTVIIPIE